MPAFLKKKKKKIECCLQSEHILWRYRTKQKNRGALLSAPRLLNKISFIFSLLDRNGALHNEPFHMFMKSITLLLCKDSKAGTTSRKKNTEKKNSVYIQNILLVVWNNEMRTHSYQGRFYSSLSFVSSAMRKYSSKREPETGALRRSHSERGVFSWNGWPHYWKSWLLAVEIPIKTLSLAEEILKNTIMARYNKKSIRFSTIVRWEPCGTKNKPNGGSPPLTLCAP